MDGKEKMTGCRDFECSSCRHSIISGYAGMRLMRMFDKSGWFKSLSEKEDVVPIANDSVTLGWGLWLPVLGLV